MTEEELKAIEARCKESNAYTGYWDMEAPNEVIKALCAEVRRLRKCDAFRVDCKEEATTRLCEDCAMALEMQS